MPCCALLCRTVLPAQHDPPKCDPLNRMGFDVLTELPPLEEFSVKLKKRSGNGGMKIKALLLDQVRCGLCCAVL